MLALLVHLCAVSSVSAFVVGGRVFTPKLRGSTVSMASIPKSQEPGQDYDADYLNKKSNPFKGWGFTNEIWKGTTTFKKSTEAEKKEARRNKLVTSANWSPRTFPEKGKGYFFFQGPTPKTAYQEDLPSFFSKENFASMTIKPAQIAVTVTGFATFVVLITLLFGPQLKAPALNLQVAPPDLSKPKAEPAKKPEAKKPEAKKPEAKKPEAKKPEAKKAAPAKKDPKAEREATKAAADKAAADKAAAKKAAAEKEAAEKAAAAEKAKAEKAAAEKAAAEKAAAEKAAAAEAAKSPEQRAAEAKAKALNEAAAKAAADKAAAEKAAAEKAAADKALRERIPELKDEPTADELRDVLKKYTKVKKFN
jgi:hypothetical protein